MTSACSQPLDILRYVYNAEPNCNYFHCPLNLGAETIIVFVASTAFRRPGLVDRDLCTPWSLPRLPSKDITSSSMTSSMELGVLPKWTVRGLDRYFALLSVFGRCLCSTRLSLSKNCWQLEGRLPGMGSSSRETVLLDRLQRSSCRIRSISRLVSQILCRWSLSMSRKAIAKRRSSCLSCSLNEKD